MMTEDLSENTTNVDISEINGERVIDFDIDANSDYEIQSSVVVDGDDRVVEAAVRFGKVEERPDLMVEKPIIHSAWTAMVSDKFDADAVEGDLSDFSHIVPHLRVERENVEEYGLETVTLSEFIAGVAELAHLVDSVLRADDETLDAEIDNWL